MVFSTPIAQPACTCARNLYVLAVCLMVAEMLEELWRDVTSLLRLSSRAGTLLQT